jgi:NAD(P)-dependent dehydrogenase (short-subunit alcohol dehydrogenase family)
MSLLGLLKGKGASGFGYDSSAEEVTAGLSLAGRTFLVTGAASGLGRETARVFAKRGARVIATGRTEASVRAACASFEGEILPMACELSTPASVRACIGAIRRTDPKLHGIVCNAGIMALPRLEKACGYELQFFTNHIGHFILVTGLLDHLDDTARVVMLSSAAHKGAPAQGVEFDNLSGTHGYGPWRAYGQSKLCNILFANHLAKRFEGSGRTANAVHPGVIATALGRSMPAFARAALSAASPLVLKTIPQGAATQCYVATNAGLDGVKGQYFADSNVAVPSALARDEALAARLWAESERIVERVQSAP